MKIPSFLVRRIHAIWQRKGLISTLLLPLSWLVQLAVACKKRRYSRPSAKSACAAPVVVVGNLILGGTGKTPVVIALVQALQAQGWHPGVISRGYGVQIGASAKTGQGHVGADEFGDEPALIAQTTLAPLAVHPCRVLAMQALMRNYPQVDVVVADDGLQHLALGRDIEIVVQDARGLGNGRVLPAGPLREPAGKLAHVDFLITNLAADDTPPSPRDIKAAQIQMRLHPERLTNLVSGQTLSWPQWQEHYASSSIDAIAAIGQPERFFSMLRAGGLTLHATLALPDHDAYLQSPFSASQAENILVTAKDAVKCARFNDPRVWVVYAGAQFSDPLWFHKLGQALEIIAQRKKQRAALNCTS